MMDFSQNDILKIKLYKSSTQNGKIYVWPMYSVQTGI